MKKSCNDPSKDIQTRFCNGGPLKNNIFQVFERK